MEHPDILQCIRTTYQEMVGIHRLVFPERPIIGSYQPDFLWYTLSPFEKLCMIGEVETTNFNGKDIPGACLLADNLAERVQSVKKPMLAFVVPDEISSADMSHLEERLNIAASRMRRIIILPAMRATHFLEWFKQRCKDEERRIAAQGC